MKLARFYRDGELSEIRMSSADEAVFEVKNFLASEQMAEAGIEDLIRTTNIGSKSHVDELRLDFNRIYRKRDIQNYVRYGFFKFSDSAEYAGTFSSETILGIKNEQRYLSACFSDYMVLKSRFGSKKKSEPYLLASLKNGYFYLLNAEELPASNPINHAVKNALTWISKKIFFKTSTK